MVRIWGMLALALLTLLAAPVWAGGPAGKMTITEFRARPQQARVYMVLGAIALTDAMELTCPQAVTVGEWEAALSHRELPGERAWVLALLELMDERGCKGSDVAAVEPNT